MNYYNEYDPLTAAWLRELINQKLLPAGDVDARSILDVTPSELRKYTQCHFFAGIGGWSLALQLADWPDDRPVWTGSCPCQPFSNAGKHLGQADERHLWPAFFELIRECRPDVIFGEQVASAIGKGWLDGISSDLGAENYACGATVLSAHSIGSPHIRQRLYWVAESNSGRELGGNIAGLGTARSQVAEQEDGANPASPGANQSGNGSQDDQDDERLADTSSERLNGEHAGNEPCGVGNATGVELGQQCGAVGVSQELAITELRGNAWDTFDLLPCTDGKTRRIESGLAPLVAGLPRGMVPSGDPSQSDAQASAEGRVMRLKGYGNSIVPALAAEFIGAFLDVTE